MTFRRSSGNVISAWCIGLAASLAMMIAPAATAFANQPGDDPGIKVAPGVFAVSASDTTDPSSSRPPEPVERAALRTGRIVGGTTTTIAEWPWQVAVTLDPTEFAGTPVQRQICGASLVTPSVLITAAHCVYDGSTNTWFPPDDHASITGRTTLSNTSQGQEILWSNYFYFVDGTGNKLYNPATSDWDVVFAVLASASPSSNSAPIQIAGANEASSWAPANENAWATGWGHTSSGGSGSDTLREVEIDTIADSFCGGSTSYGSSFHPETMLCAGEIAGGQDTCQGDSGGPLVAELGTSFPSPAQNFRFVGDTSWGFGCASPNLPGVYGRIAQNPMCTSLRNAIQAQAGVDVVGSGGCLGAPTPGGGGGGGAQPDPQPDPQSDTTPPETTITGGPPDKAKGPGVSFTFTSNEPGSGFQCSADGSAFQPCSSPQGVTNPKGTHVFQVRAIDPAGNVDPSPATDTWSKKKKKKKR